MPRSPNLLGVVLFIACIIAAGPIVLGAFHLLRAVLGADFVARNRVAIVVLLIGLPALVGSTLCLIPNRYVQGAGRLSIRLSWLTGFGSILATREVGLIVWVSYGALAGAIYKPVDWWYARRKGAEPETKSLSVVTLMLQAMFVWPVFVLTTCEFLFGELTGVELDDYGDSEEDTRT